MKGKSIAWLGAGVLLAGLAGLVVGRRRKVAHARRPEPKTTVESSEHAALRRILDLSVAYNDALYERVKSLEEVKEPAELVAAVSTLARRNEQERAVIDSLRLELMRELAEQGREFSDIEGFASLLSRYRCMSLEQAHRHLQVYERVRRMSGIPDSPELHAYMKLGFREPEQKQVDTASQLRKATETQREMMLRVGRLLAATDDQESARTLYVELLAVSRRYQELTSRIRLYRDDDPAGASAPLAELKQMYAALTPPLKQQAARLRTAECYGHAPLLEILNLLLPPSSTNP